MTNGFFAGGFARGSEQARRTSLAEERTREDVRLREAGLALREKGLRQSAGFQQKRIDLETRRVKLQEDLMAFEKKNKLMTEHLTSMSEAFKGAVATGDETKIKSTRDMIEKTVMDPVFKARMDDLGRSSERFVSLIDLQATSAISAQRKGELEGERTAGKTLGAQKTLKAGGVPAERADVAAGIPAAPAAQVQAFQMPDGKTVPIDRRDAAAIKRVIAAGGFPVTRTVQAAAGPEQTTVRSPKELAISRDSIRASGSVLDALENATKEFERVGHSAAGIKGHLIGEFAPFAQQFAATRAVMRAQGLSEKDIQDVVSIRTRVRFLTSQMLKTITQESGARYTNEERQEARAALNSLKALKSYEATVAALKTARSLEISADTRFAEDLMRGAGMSPADLATDEGFNRLFGILEANNLTRKQAGDVMEAILLRRGIVAPVAQGAQ